MKYELRYFAQMFVFFETCYKGEKNATLPSRMNEIMLGEVDRLFEFYSLKETYKSNENN